MRDMKAVIFDLDGTLLDTVEDVAFVCNKVLSSMGKETFTGEEYRPWISKGLRNLLLKAVGNEVQMDELWEKLFKTYTRYPAVHSVPFPGIVELLTELERRDVILAVLSNKEESLVRTIVDMVLPDHSFFLVCGWNEQFAAKPDPAYALHIAGQMQLNPRDIVFVGDSQVDVEAAQAAGMFAAAVEWGYGDIDSLQEARVILQKPADLLPVVGKQKENGDNA